MATTKKGNTSKATPASAETTKVDARKGATRNTTAAKAEGAAKTSPAKPAAKKAAPVKLTENQVKFLRAIHEAGDLGYEPKNKNEQRSIDAMVTRKLLKRGAKNKEAGTYRYLLTKTGAAHLTASPAS